jgi:hypothetical protein
MRRMLLISLVLSLSLACGSATTSADAGSDGGPGSDAGSTVDAGMLMLDASFENSPLTRTGNMLHIMLMNDQNTGVAGATVTVALWMPTHGHIAPAPTVVDMGSGMYHAESVDFTMAGTWEVTVTAVSGGTTVSQKLTVDAP